MNSERWRRIEEVYQAACECDEGERAAYVQAACSGDEALRREVEALLALEVRARNFMEVPALEVAGERTEGSRANLFLGKQFGSYLVLSSLGSGGMGDVYLAHDQSLDRKVALKFLRDELLPDDRARRRFLREARSAASFEHPFVCNIFEVGESDGRAFIAMEHVEGRTLRDRLREGRMSKQEVLQVAAEVAEALREAHNRGIVHRDLKPSNIMLAKNGHTKVMDFGLAKRVMSDDDSETMASTTLTPTGFTAGTPEYMSPEQLQGKRPDHRSDIFSLGIVCYEMLAGVHPFLRSSLMETASAILKEEPSPLFEFRADLPEVLQYLVRKMLSKDPVNRFQLAQEILTDVVAIQHDTGNRWLLSSRSQPITQRVPWKMRLPWFLLPIAVVTTWILSQAWRPSESETSGLSLRFKIALPEDTRLTSFYRRAIAVSPDGRQLALVGGTVEHFAALPSTSLYLRRLDRQQIRPIRGTTGGLNPIFSPDASELAFVDGATMVLKKVAVDGGEPVTLCDCSAAFGVDWDANQGIVYGSTQGLWRISASGGEPEQVTYLDEAAAEVGHFLPEVLPGGRTFLFTAVRHKDTGTKNWEQARIMAYTPATGERKLLIEGGSDARFAPTGHLVFAREGRLMAVAFDVEQLETKGSPAQVLDGINHSVFTGGMISETGVAQFSFSETGLLAYIPGSVLPELKSSVVRRDPTGAEQALKLEPKSYFSARLSADERFLLLSTLYPPRDVWLYDLERQILRRQTFEGNHTWAIWGPTASEFTFDSDVEGPDGLYVKQLDSGPGRGRKLNTGFERYQKPSSWSPDGRSLAVAARNPETGSDILVLTAEGKLEPFLATPFSEMFPEYSPDGAWLAYVSDESVRPEVYVRPYPGPGRALQISSGGGNSPAWSRDGETLYYRSGNQFVAARIIIGQEGLEVGGLTTLFEEHSMNLTSPVRAWDVTPDGSFILIRVADKSMSAAIAETFFPTEINLVQNWFQELRQEVRNE